MSADSIPEAPRSLILRKWEVAESEHSLTTLTLMLWDSGPDAKCFEGHHSSWCLYDHPTCGWEATPSEARQIVEAMLAKIEDMEEHGETEATWMLDDVDADGNQSTIAIGLCMHQMQHLAVALETVAIAIIARQN